MKKLTVLVIAAIVLSGCSPKEMQESVQNSDVIVQSIDIESDRLMIEYNQLIEEEKSPKEIIEFIDNNINYISQINADETMINLFEYLWKYNQIYMDTFFKGNVQHNLREVFKGDVIQSEIYKIKNSRTKKLVKDVLSGGYKIIMSEGEYYPIINFDYLKRFAPYVSNETQEFLKIMSRESANILSDDGALNVSWDEVGERLVGCEVYLNQYPKGDFRKQIISLYLAYLNVYMWGIDNSPVVDGDGTILPEVINSYDKIASKYAETKIGQLIEEYVNVVNENHDKIDEEIKKLRQEFYENNISTLDM